MKNSNIIAILKCFKREEINKFEEFIESPFFNKKRIIINFYRTLKKYYPDFKEENISKENIYKEIYLNSTFNYQIFKNISSSLLQLLEKFLLIIAMEKRGKFENQRFLIEELKERQLINLIQRNLNKMESSLKQNSKLGLNYFFSKFNFYSLKYNFNQANYQNPKDLIGFFNESSKYFSIYILQQLVLFETNSKTLSVKFSHIFKSNALGDILNNNIKFDTLLPLIESKNDKDYQYIAIFCYLYKTFVTENDTVYLKKTIDLVNEHYNNISNSDLQIIYTLLMSSCIHKINSNCSGVEFILLDLYEKYFQRRIHKTNSRSFVNINLFQGFVQVASILKEFKLAENYINQFRNEFAPIKRMDYYNYFMGIVLFHKTNYKEALKFLAKTKLTSHYDKVEIKSMELIISCEQGHFDSAIMIIDSYKHFLKTSILPSNLKERYHLFVTFTNQIVKLKEGNEKSKFNLISLREKIFKSNSAYKSWLLKKIGELEK